MVARLLIGGDNYEFVLEPTLDNLLAFAWERIGPGGGYLGSVGKTESLLKDLKVLPGGAGSMPRVAQNLCDAISRWVAYHFHDTSLLSGVRRQRAINDNEVLREDGENLAAFLYRIGRTDPRSYSQIRDVVRLAAPFFDDFRLRPAENPDLIELEWRQKGADYNFKPHQLSDGTLRFICLATALLQPDPPPTMLFDEPELGLHPYALTLLGALFSQAPDVSRQLIVSTQSEQLLNEFSPEDVVVVERANGESVFRRLEEAGLSEWLKEYSLGKLWLKNILGGRPRPEVRPS